MLFFFTMMRLIGWLGWALDYFKLACDRILDIGRLFILLINVFNFPLDQIFLFLMVTMIFVDLLIMMVIFIQMDLKLRSQLSFLRLRNLNFMYSFFRLTKDSLSRFKSKFFNIISILFNNPLIHPLPITSRLNILNLIQRLFPFFVTTSYLRLISTFFHYPIHRLFFILLLHIPSKLFLQFFLSFNMRLLTLILPRFFLMFFSKFLVSFYCWFFC
mmetsp:Transcript_28467/g.32556  ORF Transcript_28467/g.32556 Transcript_28467/m.32556 type:complete len:215 (+) Transcript_28467:993-1637(+)